MDNLTLNYVARIVGPERMQLYVDCHQLLTSFYPDGWGNVLSIIGDQLEQKTINDIEYLLHNAIIENLSAMTQECGVYLNHRYDFHNGLRQLYHLTHALYHVEHYPNTVALRTLFDAHQSANDQLSAVLHEVEPGLDVDTFCSLVADISPTTIARLDHALSKNLEMVEPYVLTHRLMPVVQDLITQYAAEFPEIAEMPFQHITGTMDAYVTALREHIVAAKPPVAARLLILCGVMAGLDETTARTGIGAAIEHLYRDQLRLGITVSRLTMTLPYPEALNHDAS